MGEEKLLGSVKVDKGGALTSHVYPDIRVIYKLNSLEGARRREVVPIATSTSTSAPFVSISRSAGDRRGRRQIARAAVR
jgi:hypothetical protein